MDGDFWKSCAKPSSSPPVSFPSNPLILQSEQEVQAPGAPSVPFQSLYRHTGSCFLSCPSAHFLLPGERGLSNTPDSTPLPELDFSR